MKISRLLTVGLLVFSRFALANAIDLEYLENLEKWKSSEIVDYSVKQVRACECVIGMIPKLVSVKDGALDHATVLEPVTKDMFFMPEEYGIDLAIGEEIVGPHLQTVSTIDQLFDIISRAITGDVAHYEVEYDERYGFPARVVVDYYSDVEDEEFIITLYDFEPKT